MTLIPHRYARVPLAAAAAAIPARAHRVLIAICASADRHDRAWPGVTELSRRTGIPRKKIPAEVKRLEVAGLIRVERQPGRGSVYAINFAADSITEPSPNEGTLTVPCDGDTEAPELSPQTVPTVPSDGTELSPEAGTKQNIEQTQEQKERLAAVTSSAPVAPAEALLFSDLDQTTGEQPVTAHAAAKHQVDEAFDEFWQAYPRRVGKGAAKPAYARALKKAPAAHILIGARRYAEKVRRDGTEPQYVAHPKTWLNGERWLDEPDTCRPREPPSGLPRNGFVGLMMQTRRNDDDEDTS